MNQIKCPYCNKIIMEEILEEPKKRPKEIPGNYLWHQGSNSSVCSECNRDIEIIVDIKIKKIKIYKVE